MHYNAMMEAAKSAHNNMTLQVWEEVLLLAIDISANEARFRYENITANLELDTQLNSYISQLAELVHLAVTDLERSVCFISNYL